MIGAEQVVETHCAQCPLSTDDTPQASGLCASVRREKNWNSNHQDSPAQISKKKKKKSPLPVATYEGKIFYYHSFVMLNAIVCEMFYNLLSLFNTTSV